MRVLRTTMFADPYHPPVMTVVRDSDTKDTLESARNQLQTRSPEILTICEIFEMPDGSIEEATFKAQKRAQRREIPHKHMAMLFYWLVATFKRGNQYATIGMPRPTPLSAEDMRYVFRLLTLHPGYRDFSVIGVAKDGTPVQLVRGKVE